MRIKTLRSIFKYDPETGELLHYGSPVRGTKAERLLYPRVCYALHFGYLPEKVEFRNGDDRDYRIANLVDPGSLKTTTPGAATALDGVYQVSTGRFQGVVFKRGRYYTTEVSASPIRAASLRLKILDSLEWVESQKGTAQ